MRRALLATAAACAFTASAEARSGNSPRSPTQLDNTVWTVTRIAGKQVEAAAPTISFYGNGRVQISTSCSFMLAGDFSVFLWRVKTRWLDKPTPRLPCGEIARREEALTAEILDQLRSFQLSDKGRLITLKDARGRLIEAAAKP